MLQVALIFFLLCDVTALALQVALPLNSQVPPVARVGQFFWFQFPLATFAPISNNIQYTISGGPAWLSLDSATRTLWGTPGTSDLGTTSFTLTAADSSGAAVLQPTLVVVADAAPSATVNVQDVLEKDGPATGSNSVSAFAMSDLQISFPSNLFDGNGKSLSYYSTMEDHTPLPSWISFDSKALRFSGKVPSMNNLPRTFGLMLIASDIPGFASAWFSFNVTVISTELAFEKQDQYLNVQKGASIHFSSLRDQILLNGQKCKDSDIQSASAELPSGLSFDPGTLSITGTLAEDNKLNVIKVTVHDVYGHTATTTIHLALHGGFFHHQLEPLNVTQGQHFNYTIDRAMFSRPDVDITVSLGDTGKWLHFDPQSLTIYGEVPQDVKPGTITGSIIATEPNSSSGESQALEINVHSVDPTAFDQGIDTTDDHSSKNEASSSESGSDEDSHNGHSKSKIVTIIAATVPCIVVAILALVLSILFCRRPISWRRKNRGIKKPEISRPIIQVDQWPNNNLDGNGDDLEKGPQEVVIRTPERPPQIDIVLPMKSVRELKDRPNSLAISLGDNEAAILKDFDRSYGDSVTAHRHNPSESMKIPTELARMSRVSESSTLTKSRPQHYRKSTRTSITRNIGLPVNRRLSGLGHGRGTYGSPVRGLRSSMSSVYVPHRCHCNSVSTYDTQSTDMLSRAPSTLLVPPPRSSLRGLGHKSLPLDRRYKSIRMLSATPDGGPDRRSIQEKRDSFIKNRASRTSPFFAAGGGSSRASSGVHQAPGLASTSVLEPNPLFPDSLRRHRTQKSVATTCTASSAEPSSRPRKRWHQRLLSHAEGYPCSVPSTAKSSRQFGSATEVSSIYSQHSSPSKSVDHEITILPDDNDDDYESYTSTLEEVEEGPVTRDEDSFVLPGPPPILTRTGRRRLKEQQQQPQQQLCLYHRKDNAAATPTLHRDATGNVTGYGVLEEPTIEEVAIAVSGRISQARRSKLENRKSYDSLRVRGRRGRTPLSVISNASTGSREDGAGRGGSGIRMGEGRGKKVVSVENEGRWGSLRGRGGWGGAGEGDSVAFL